MLLLQARWHQQRREACSAAAATPRTNQGLSSGPARCHACRLQGLSDADVKQLQGVLEEQVEANLGMAMIYTLIGVAQEWLNEKVGGQGAPRTGQRAGSLAGGGGWVGCKRGRCCKIAHAQPARMLPAWRARGPHAVPPAAPCKPRDFPFAPEPFLQMTQVGAPSVDPEAERKRREAEEEARIAEIRAHGTAVTPEAFAEWKAKFDAEQALARSKLGEAAGAADRAGRLTGKQWFMQQEAQHLEVG